MKINRRNFSTIAFAAPLLIACKNDPARAIIGTKSPKLKAQTIDGNFVHFGELPRPTVVHFFGLWCGPCMAEMPVWQGAIKQIKNMGGIDIVQLHLGVVPSQYESLNKWNDALDADIKTPLILDESREIGDQFQAFGTPTTILIDKNQIIVEHFWSLNSGRNLSKLIDVAKATIGQ